MNETRWTWLLLPSGLLILSLLIFPNGAFLRASLFADLGFGRAGSDLQFDNYLRFFQDAYYLNSLWLTVMLAAIAAGLTVVLAFPVAYVLARMRSRWALVLLAVIVISSFISEVIKVLGFLIILSASGPLSTALMAVGLIDEPLVLIGKRPAVVIGFLHFTLGFAVMMFYGVVRTIPSSLEEAAQIHGSPRWRVFPRVVLPLCLPTIVTGYLLFFNLCMGAFTSAAFLGGGQILTLPVMIQRTILNEVKYGMGSTQATVLLLTVVAINLVAIAAIKRLHARRIEII